MSRTRKLVALPGVLASAEAQFAPVAKFLPMDFVPRDDFHRKFNPHRVQIEAAHAIQRDPFNTTLIGASMGGVQAPFVIERLVNMGVIVDDIHVVVVDAPWGGKTLVQGVSKVTPFVNFLHPVTRFIPVPVQEGGLPKRESITIPATSDQRLRVSFGNAETEERYADWVVETARRSLSGYRFSQLIGQTAWMKRCARNGSLERAVQSLRGLRVTYIACVDSSNDVVRQPMAVDLWSKQLPDMQVIEVATPHCAFLQSQPIFEPVIADLLNVWK